MKNFFFLVTTICLVFSQTIAQVPEFDLAKYARPILKRQSLDMATDLGASQFARPFLQTSNPSSNVSLGANLQLSYRYLHNDLGYQGISTMILDMHPFHTRQSINVEPISKQYTLDQGMNLSSEHRWYNQKQYFWGIEGRLHQTYQRSSSLQERMTTLEERKEDRLQTALGIDLDLPVVVGKGRLEPIQDARHGLFILQALEKQELLVREVQEQDILDFAAQISQWKNRRYFDIRLQRIWELEQIHTYLIEQGIIDELSPTLFAIVQDMWSFGYQIVRWAGNRTSIGIDPNIFLRRRFYDKQTTIVDSVSVSSSSRSNTRSHMMQIHPSLFFAYVSEKPLSESWQRSMNLEVEIGPSQEQFKHTRTQDGSPTDESKGSSWRDIPLSRASFRYAMGYYPNTRTFLEGELKNEWAQVLAFRNSFSANGDEPVAFSSIQSALNVNAYYYLSPRTRLTLTYGGSLIAYKQGLETISPIDFVNELKNQTQFRQSLNLRFEYAWF